MLFDKNGEYRHDIDVVDKYGMSGYLKNENSLKTRLTDIAVNDKERFVCYQVDSRVSFQEPCTIFWDLLSLVSLLNL